MSIERMIGIDFGTSTSVVKVKTYSDGEPMGAPEMSDYVRFDNKASIPTLVYSTNDGKYLVGYEAEYAAVKGTLHQNFKLDLVSADKETYQQAVLYTGLFLEHLYDEYNNQKAYFPACDGETTYISYPAKWNADLRNLMISLVEKAGFKNVKGLDEPTAAIHTVMVQECSRLALNSQNTANILMIDMGAGTTDLVLCRYTPYENNKIRILNTWPKSDSQCLFGGREIDEVLCEYIKAYLAGCGLPNVNNFRSKYLDKCKAWKENNVSPVLREKDGVVRFCGFIDALLAMLDVDDEFPPISRASFEHMLSPYLSEFPKMVTECLASVGFDKSELDYVILTGGHSQWYFASEILSGVLTRFGNPELPKIKADTRRVIQLAIPQETVAAGLVYQKLNVKPAKNDDTGKPQGNNTQSNANAIKKGIEDGIRAVQACAKYQPMPSNTPPPPIRTVECKIAGIGSNLFEKVKGVVKENEASVYAVYGDLNIYEDRLEFIVNVRKHPTYSKNKNITLLYSLIKGIKKKYISAFTAEETLASIVPYVALGKLIANGNKSISINYNIDAEYILTFSARAQSDEILALITKMIGKCKGR